MIKALIGAAKKIIGNPLLLLPALLAIAILFVLAYVFAPFAIDLLLNAVFLELVPDAPLQSLPYQFAAIYGMQLGALIIFVILGGVLFTGLSYWYAAYIKMGLDGKASIGACCKETVSALGKVFAFIVFVAVISLLFGIVLWMFSMIFIAIAWLGAILMLLASLLAFYLYIKLAFSVQSLAMDNVKVKQALQNSWKFAIGKFWLILIFVVILAVVNQAIVFVGAYASDLILDDIIGTIILAVFWSISLAYTSIAMALYYSEKR